MDTNWKRAACRGKNHDAFFDPEKEEACKAICRTCPIEVQCGEEATILRYAYGIFGGMNQEEREKYRRLLLRRKEYSAYRTA